MERRISKTTDWIGKNVSIGGLVRNAGSALGTVTKVSAQGFAVSASLLASKPETKQKIRDISTSTGKSIDSVAHRASTMGYSRR